MQRSTRALCCALACTLFSASLGLTQNTQSPTVTVAVDGRTYQVASAANSVGDLLVDLNIALRDLDRTVPALKTKLSDHLVVRVTRIDRQQVVEETPIKAQTTVLPVPNRTAGYNQVLSQGRDGLLRRVVEVWKKDGKETRRAVLRQQVVVRPKDTVVMRAARDLPSRGGDWRHPLRMRATAYDPGPRSCGRYADGRTANGMRATKGVVAVDTRVIPMGTRLYIPGYGFAIAADRGSAIKGLRIDLCFDTYAEARRFGSRRVDVYILR